MSPDSLRCFREFVAEVNADGISRDGRLRSKWGRIKARVMVGWRLRLHYWLHPEALTYVSQEAFDAVAADEELLSALAAAARSDETGETPARSEGPQSGGVSRNAPERSA